MSAHGTGEVLVRLSREEAEEQLEEGAISEVYLKLRAALDEHDAAINLMALPWRAAEIGGTAPRGWAVLDCANNVICDGLTKQEARLMASSPELADALDLLVKLLPHLIEGYEINTHDLPYHRRGDYTPAYERAIETLTKAGRR